MADAFPQIFRCSWHQWRGLTDGQRRMMEEVPLDEQAHVLRLDSTDYLAYVELYYQRSEHGLRGYAPMLALKRG